ncbi:MAG: hypothetical protein WBE68_20040 [Candidatus Nitrosopolaris sp.]
MPQLSVALIIHRILNHFYIGEEGLADDNPNAEYLPRIPTFDLEKFLGT